MKNSLITYLTAFTFFIGGSVTSPQDTNKKQKKQVIIKNHDNDLNKELSQLKDSIISCVSAVEKSKEVISLNEPYLKNLDKKIEEKQKIKSELQIEIHDTIKL